MSKSKNLYRDVVTGVSFVAGVFGFMSGEFVASTMLFALASVSSNLDLEGRFRA